MKRFNIILSFLFLISCTVYEDDPIMHYGKPGKRIDGEWKVDSYKVDGVDSMWVIKALHLDGRWDFNYIPTYAPSYYELPQLSIVSYQDGVRHYYSGKWLSEKKKGDYKTFDVPFVEIWLSYYYVDTSTVFDFGRIDTTYIAPIQMPIERLTKYKITRLAYNQMWLEIDHSNGKHYELRFIKY